MNNVKITILVMKFPPKWLGGTEQASYNLANYLKNYHNINIITTLDEGIIQNDINGFAVCRVHKSEIRYFGMILYWIKIFFIIKKIKPGIIHVQGLYMAIPAVLAKIILNVPYIISGRGSDVYNSWPYKTIISKLGMQHAKISIALTQNMKNEMQKISNKKIIVVPNGIDTKIFNNTKYNSRKKLFLDIKMKIILFVGRLEPIKGLKYLIKAIDILKFKETNLKLLIIGDGTELQELKVLIKNLKLERYVIFLGKIPNELIPVYMAASDIFVLPSISEGFPVVILEAMATGLPIVTTKIRGLEEIVVNGVNGFLVEPKNHIQLSKKITILLNDEKLSKKISKTNKERSKFYDWQNVSHTLENLYNL